MVETFRTWWPARGLPALGLAAALFAASAGCGGSATPASPGDSSQSASGGTTVMRAATLRPGQRVPMPAGKALLTLTGKVSATNAGRTIVLDRPVLEQMGLVRVRVYEPWIKKDVEFRGVWLADLLKVAGAAADYAEIRVTALDDYTVTLTAADVRAGGVLLATSAGDGADIAVDKGGPTRIIFVGGVEAGANADQWIWSLKTIDVR